MQVLGLKLPVAQVIIALVATNSGADLIVD
jgi:hypothetical protein